MPFPKFFQEAASALNPANQRVSTPHVSSEVASVGSQLVSSGLQDISPNSTIFTKMIQVISETQAVLHPNSHALERLVHTVRGVFVTIALGMQIAIYFKKCDRSNESLCMTLSLFEKHPRIERGSPLK